MGLQFQARPPLETLSDESSKLRSRLFGASIWVGSALRSLLCVDIKPENAGSKQSKPWGVSGTSPLKNVQTIYRRCRVPHKLATGLRFTALPHKYTHQISNHALPLRDAFDFGQFDFLGVGRSGLTSG